MLLKGPLIAFLLLVIIARWWAKRSTRFRYGVLIVGWLGVAAQAASTANQTWGRNPEPTGAVLAAWVMLAILGGVVFWLQRDTRPDKADGGEARRSARGRTGDRRAQPPGSAARSAGRTVRSLLGEDRKR